MQIRNTIEARRDIGQRKAGRKLLRRGEISGTEDLLVLALTAHFAFQTVRTGKGCPFDAA